ncbi:MAG: Serine--tRNA ligase [Chlamydiales bacterium]|nr:Serine--tRNA ligase [Chlamydiales bacterium]
MLDIKEIRKDKARIEKLVQKKEPKLSLDAVMQLDQALRQLKTDSESLLHERNALSKLVGERKRKQEPADDLMEQVRAIGEKIATLEKELAEKEVLFVSELSKIPNIPFDEVKDSQDKELNEVIKVVGEKPSFDFEPKNHLQLNEKLKLFDFERAAKVAGSRWASYRGLGARLEWALLNSMLDIQHLNGFEMWMPPLMVRPPAMFGSGQMPKFAGQFYEMSDKNEPLYLIPTAEVSLNALHMDEIFDAAELPKKYCAYTPCFRKESGAAGAEERGLIRIHQFNKVEMFAFTKPEESEQMFEQMVSSAEEVLKALGLHYRLCRLVTGDMSFTASKTIDIEVWLPGQNRYYEVSSISHCTDYQARRSKIRYKEKGGKPQLVHILNGSGLATPRLMVALLENNQKADGSVDLPPILAEKLKVHTLC